ncbi:MAG: glycosyltransferase family 4 protein [Acidiphilium sp.]|nr:glycosyltransferase family 4 protein [Acidiphilium sp.]
MKIVIALPAYYSFPIGGYHVQYAYANYLNSLGHDVTIVFPRYADGTNSIGAYIKTPVWASLIKLRNRPLISSFVLNKEVKIKFVRNLQENSIPNGDAIIATAWQTAEIIGLYAKSKFKKKFYIVYDYEHYMTGDEILKKRISATYKLDLRIIASSKVVQKTVESLGGRVIANIPCGIDFDSFGMDIEPVVRNPHTIGFPLRRESFKGAEDAFEAVKLLKNRFGHGIDVAAFGSQKFDTPTWIKYIEFPNQKQLRAFYNSRAIFFVPSHFEGWGLPGSESMACGSALVTTDNGGCLDYAVDEKTALVVPPKRPDLMADAIISLIESRARRVKLATEGHKYINNFTWERSVYALNNILVDN